MINADWRAALKHLDSFSSCCGTRYVTKPSSFKRSGRFILLGEGAMAEEMDGPKQTINVINTQNGPITVRVRHVW